MSDPADTGKSQASRESKQAENKLSLSEAEWRERLSPMAFHVTRQHGTERAWSHPGFPSGPGTFRCVGCGTALFDKATKYDSGCGWPSFFNHRPDAPIATTEDNSLGMRRIEVHCDNCGAHLGHVFPDGPNPTGLRYCINGVALDFEPDLGAVAKS